MATKPTGEITLNTGHALYSNILRCLVIEDDGTVREIVTGETGSSITTATGATSYEGCPNGTIAAVDTLAELSVLDGGTGWTASTAAWSHAVYTDVAQANALTSVAAMSTDGNAPSGKSYTHALRTGNWNATAWAAVVVGGWSGNVIGPSNIAFGSTAGIFGAGMSVSSSTWNNDIYLNGTISTGSTTGLDATNDSNNGGTTYIVLNPSDPNTGTIVAYYYAIFDKKLSTAEWNSLNSDPWDLFGQTTSIPTVIESHPQRIVRKKGWYV